MLRNLLRFRANRSVCAQLLPVVERKLSMINTKVTKPEIFCFAKEPKVNPVLKITDPIISIKTIIPAVINQEFILPTNNEDKDAVEPLNNIQEKKAARLIVIRRAKMKKHKWKKMQKRMKFVFAKKRQQRELKKEKAFQAILLTKIKEAEKFDPKEYVLKQIQLTQWKPPVTRVKGFYAPDWVIEEHFKNLEEEKRISDRIEECLKKKKL